MFNGYPVCPALTSLVLLASLLVAPASPLPRRQSCSDIRRLYSPRVLRELRLRLMIAYAESHEHRAGEIAAAIKDHRTLEPDGFALNEQTRVQKDQFAIHAQESDDPRMKHLLAYVAMNCL
jgi:hypothetical protein